MSVKGPWGMLIGCALLAGCSTFGLRGAAHFDVQVSFLDHVTFTFQEAGPATADEHPVLVRITLSGSGHVHYARGRSSRVHDSFWNDRQEEHVDDLFTDQLVLREEQVKEVLQGLVDAGLFERDKQGRNITDYGNAHVLIQAKLGDRHAVIATDATAFVAVYRKLAARFAR